MKKIKKKNKNKRKKGNKGGAILFTVGIACLIALVGLVHIVISDMIEEYVEKGNKHSEEMYALKEENERQIDKNNDLFSNENILNLLREHKNIFGESLSVRSPKDTIKVRF